MCLGAIKRSNKCQKNLRAAITVAGVTFQHKVDL